MPTLQKLITSILVGLTVLLVISGCSLGNQPAELKVYTSNFIVMKTIVEVRIDTSKSQVEVSQLFAELSLELDRLHLLLSAFVPESDVSRINNEAGVQPVSVSPETFAVIKKALAMADLTAGTFDITLAPVLKLYNYEKKEKPSSTVLLTALDLVDYSQVVLNSVDSTVLLPKPGMALDLGGIAKGYVVDRALDFLLQAGVEHCVVNAGGDLKLSRAKPDGSPWRVGIKDPRNHEIGVFFARVTINSGAIVTSGDYERYFEEDGLRYHHIIDPATGLPASKARSVTIIGPEAESADLLSTAVFVMGAHAGITLIDGLEGYEAIIYDSDNKIHLSAGLESETIKLQDGSQIMDIKLKELN